MSILIVEDEALVLMIAQEAVEDAGFHVVAAEDGPSAMTILNAQGGRQVTGLITDYNLGSSVTGRDVIEAMRRTHPKAPVILASAFPDSVSNEWRWQYDVELLIKPYRTKQLVEAVRRLFQSQALPTY